MITKIFVPKEKFKEVASDIRQIKAKHLPFYKTKDGYYITFKDETMSLYLALKYDIMLK